MTTLHEPPSGERVHIGFFGRRNAGKSSLVNAVAGQALSVVSPVAGTTTDPVAKAMELLPLGPVVLLDTPGFDDEGDLGALRVERTRAVLARADCAVLVLDGPAADADRQLIALLEARGLPWLKVYNKADLHPAPADGLAVSARTGAGIAALKERLARLLPDRTPPGRLAGDLLRLGELAVLVVPLDRSAPKGRLILPQQQVIRDLLEAGAAALTVRDTEYVQFLEKLPAPPALVVADSQVFGPVAAATPAAVPLTSFSILMARYKGFLKTAVRGAAAIDRLRDGDTVLVAEGCTHHRQCEDIGTVQLPRLLRARTGRDLRFQAVSGRDFPADLTPCALVLHCGGCMLTPRALQARLEAAGDVPFTNYGVAIAHLRGILPRALAALPEFAAGAEKNDENPWVFRP